MPEIDIIVKELYRRAVCEGDVVCAQAARLIKGHAPRVLTPEEIPKVDGAVMIEWRDSDPALQWGLYRFAQGNFYTFHMNDISYRVDLSVARYGVDWRCWSKRPTDEQREVTVWTEDLR